MLGTRPELKQEVFTGHRKTCSLGSLQARIGRELHDTGTATKEAWSHVTASYPLEVVNGTQSRSLLKLLLSKKVNLGQPGS